VYWPDGRGLFRRRWPKAWRWALLVALLTVVTISAAALVRLL